MDRLSDLPINNTPLSPQEQQVMHQYFGPSPQGSQGPPQGLQGPPKAQPEHFSQKGSAPASSSGNLNWKLIGSVSLLFVMLANPWIDMALCKIPYCGDRAILLLAIKLVIFVIVYIILSMYI